MMNLGPHSRHGLNQRNQKKLKYVSRICSIVILRMMRNSFSLIFGAIYIYYSLMAYLSEENYFSKTSLVIWFVILQTWAHFITSAIVLPYAILYFTVFYMKQRFHQLNERFEKIKRRGRLYLLVQLFISHNRLSIMTYKYNEFFKYLIAINHFCVTLIVTLMYYIFFYGSGGLFLRCCNLAVGTLDTVMIFLVTRFAGSLAKESTSLYPVVNSYICRARISHTVRWKVSIFARALMATLLFNIL